MSSRADQDSDDKLLDAYLRGDSSYSKLYRDVETDDVPSELDASVVAEARAAVTRRKGLLWQRATPILAIAATAVLTVSVVIQSDKQTPARFEKRQAQSELSVANSEAQVEVPILPPSEMKDMAPLVELDMKLPSLQFEARQGASAKAPAAVAAPAPIVESASRERAKEVKKETELEKVTVTGSYIKSTPEDAALPVEVITSEDLQQQGIRGVGPRGTIPAAAPSKSRSTSEATSTKLEEVVVTAQTRRESGSAAGPRGTVAANSVTRADRKQEQRDRERSPADWLVYIRELRAERKNREADREWQRFVEAYPAFKVDENDSARPRSSR